jgi:hypothetical protein
MESWQIIAISVVALAVVALLVWALYSRSRSRRLRERFGPEYDRTVNETGNRRTAEATLVSREKRLRKLRVRELDASERRHFASEWRQTQADFVDNPVSALDYADRLIDEVMRARGYPTHSEDDRVANISAAHPYRLSDYRAAQRIRNEARTTEELRKAFVHYRALFDELLGGEHEELKRAS